MTENLEVAKIKAYARTINKCNLHPNAIYLGTDCPDASDMSANLAVKLLAAKAAGKRIYLVTENEGDHWTCSYYSN